MTDHFLVVTRVNNEWSAMSNAIQSALQHNKTYRTGSDDGLRDAFRAEWAELIREESQRYTEPVSDVQHCEAIQRISDRLRARFGQLLSDGHLRYGTSQKALNLYLKFLWRLGKVAPPPHCPVDRIILSAGGIDGVWTKCDSVEQYMAWINVLKTKARPRSLAEWEYELWTRDAGYSQNQPPGSSDAGKIWHGMK
jgi:hypothetical protein